MEHRKGVGTSTGLPKGFATNVPILFFSEVANHKMLKDFRYHVTSSVLTAEFYSARRDSFSEFHVVESRKGVGTRIGLSKDFGDVVPTPQFLKIHRSSVGM